MYVYVPTSSIIFVHEYLVNRFYILLRVFLTMGLRRLKSTTTFLLEIRFRGVLSAYGESECSGVLWTLMVFWLIGTYIEYTHIHWRRVWDIYKSYMYVYIYMYISQTRFQCIHMIYIYHICMYAYMHMYMCMHTYMLM